MWCVLSEGEKWVAGGSLRSSNRFTCDGINVQSPSMVIDMDHTAGGGVSAGSADVGVLRVGGM